MIPTTREEADPITREEAEASVSACGRMANHIFAVMNEQLDMFLGPGEVRGAVEIDGSRGLRVFSPREADPTSTEIGRVVREAREKAGMSQEDLAQALGTLQHSVARLEEGVQPARVETLFDVAQALKVPPTELVGRVRPAGQAVVNREARRHPKSGRRPPGRATRRRRS